MNITTNGIAKIAEELLGQIKNERVKISFSVYDRFLNERQKILLNENIEKVASVGISYSISHPLWLEPGDMKDYGYSEEQKKIGENPVVV